MANKDEDKSYQQMSEDRRPIPDPTLLTTQALTREIAAIREVIEQNINGVTAVNKEKFDKVEQQFELVERQRVEQKKDTKDAVDAALTAQKEAVREQTTASEKAISKSETATNELLKQLASTFSTEAASLRREIGEVKDRVTALENQKQGAKETQTDTRASTSAIVGYIVGAVGVLSTIVTLAILFTR